MYRIMKGKDSVQKLIEYGACVFEDSQNFHIWMNSKNNALANIKPSTLLDSEEGIIRIMDELGRIENGILA